MTDDFPRQHKHDKKPKSHLLNNGTNGWKFTREFIRAINRDKTTVFDEIR